MKSTVNHIHPDELFLYVECNLGKSRALEIAEHLKDCSYCQAAKKDVCMFMAPLTRDDDAWFASQKKSLGTFVAMALSVNPEESLPPVNSFPEKETSVPGKARPRGLSKWFQDLFRSPMASALVVVAGVGIIMSPGAPQQQEIILGETIYSSSQALDQPNLLHNAQPKSNYFLSNNPNNLVNKNGDEGFIDLPSSNEVVTYSPSEYLRSPVNRDGGYQVVLAQSQLQKNQEPARQECLQFSSVMDSVGNNDGSGIALHSEDTSTRGMNVTNGNQNRLQVVTPSLNPLTVYSYASAISLNYRWDDRITNSQIFFASGFASNELSNYAGRNSQFWILESNVADIEVGDINYWATTYNTSQLQKGETMASPVMLSFSKPEPGSIRQTTNPSLSQASTVSSSPVGQNGLSNAGTLNIKAGGKLTIASSQSGGLQSVSGFAMTAPIIENFRGQNETAAPAEAILSEKNYESPAEGKIQYGASRFLNPNSLFSSIRPGLTIPLGPKPFRNIRLSF